MPPTSPASHVVIVNWKDRAHPAAGGAEVFCESVAQELVALGFRVTLLASRPAGLPRRSEVDGYTVRRGGSTYTVYLFALLWLLRHRRDVHAVIDSQNGIPFFTPLAVRRTTSTVLLIHHVHQEQFALYFPPVMARVGRWLERTGSRIVYRDRPVAAVSPSSRTEIRRKLGLRGAIYVVPNGSSATPQRGAHERSVIPTITCVGRLVPHKRWELLVELARDLRGELPALQVHLVGTGPEEQRLAALVEKYGIADTVTLHGFVSEAERDRLLAQAWLTVSTSVGEGWGLSIIEAATLGVPAVALDVPGLRDSVCDGRTGWLAADLEDLLPTVAGALKALAEPKRAAGFAANCHAWADSLRWSASAERFHAIFAEEAERLGSREQRRERRSDVATLVTLEPHGAVELDLTALGATDQASFCRTCLPHHTGPFTLLLFGRDERHALAFLTTCGLDVRTQVRSAEVCRPHQLLSWQGTDHAHNVVSLRNGVRCPAAAAIEARRVVERPLP